jgi:hypothetical protein
MKAIHTSLIIGLFAMSACPAVADELGMEGSYFGVAVSGDRSLDAAPSLLGLVNQTGWVFDEALRQYRTSRPPGAPVSDQAAGNQFQGRLDLGKTPLSLRGTVFVGDTATAVAPSITYDLGVGKSANVYAGVGYAIVNSSNGLATPVGSSDGVVLTTGVEAAAGRNLVVFGDAKVNLNERTPTGDPKIRLQFGAGIRF